MTTIVGISTALGIGAISIVRISGPNAVKIASKVFKGNDLLKTKTHTIHYGHIVDKKEIIDEVLITVMKKPRTYTKEDVIEINCHGGINSTNRVLELLLDNGCELAEPGEFTKRAFLNGRIDLIKAEAVMNLIKAKTDLNRKTALNQLSGQMSAKINQIRENLTKLITNIDVNIDYPEYQDVEQIEYKKLKNKIEMIKIELNKLYEESKNGRMIEEGIKTVIIGKPNVGKSSLLNQLIEEEKAIVTEIEGTTRDVVEGKVNVGGILLDIKDTAGIRDTENKIEKIGVEKSFALIEEAELILFVIDHNQKLSDDEKRLLQKVIQKPYIIVINKKDLPQKVIKKELEKYQTIEISTFERISIENLKEKIKKMFNLEEIEKKDLTYLTSARSINLLKKALDNIKDVEKGIKKEVPIDILEIDIKRSWYNLGLITGQVYDDQLIEQLFKDFCLGK